VAGGGDVVTTASATIIIGRKLRSRKPLHGQTEIDTARTDTRDTPIVKILRVSHTYKVVPRESPAQQPPRLDHKGLTTTGLEYVRLGIFTDCGEFHAVVVRVEKHRARYESSGKRTKNNNYYRLRSIVRKLIINAINGQSKLLARYCSITDHTKHKFGTEKSGIVTILDIYKRSVVDNV